MRNPFRYFNSSPEVIRLTVMLYIRYPLSLRQVEDLLFERGIDICHETVRLWWNRFGPRFAAENQTEARRKLAGRPSVALAPGRGVREDQTVRCTIFGGPWITKARCSRCSPRNAGIARPPWRFSTLRQTQAIVTDRLRSYGAAMKEIGVERRQVCGRWLNNRAENAHQPFRRREGAMARFRDIKTLQKFTSVHASIHNHFSHDRHLNRRATFKDHRSAALAEWRELAT
jgi:putative transposase